MGTPRFLGLLLLVILLVLTLAARPANGQTAYEARDLGTLGGDESEAYALNDYGAVVGRALDDSAEPHTFVWQNGTMVSLFHEQPWGRITMPLARYTVGYGISNTDLVVNYVMEESEENPDLLIPSAVLFRPAVQSDLPTPYPGEAITYLGIWCVPTGISTQGTFVVGYGNLDCTDDIFAFILQPNNGAWGQDDGTCIGNALIINVRTLQSDQKTSAATAVNNAGQVVGWSYSETDGYAAFLLSPTVDLDGNPITWFEDDGTGANELMTSLGTLPGADGLTYGHNSWARDINEAGVIVGEADTGDYETHAFLFDGGDMIDLGTLGGANSSAAAVNDDGQVVGWALDSQGVQRAFIVEPLDADADGVGDTWFVDDDADGLNDLMNDLNNRLASGFRLRLTEARDVNQQGAIVGWGLNGAGVDAIRSAFLLTPTAASDDDDGGDDGGDDAIADADLPPVINDPSDSDDDADTSEVDTGPRSFPLTHWLCGTGFVQMLPLSLAALAGLRFRPRR